MVRLRLAVHDDLSAVLALDRSSSPVFSRASSYAALLDRPGLLLVAIESVTPPHINLVGLAAWTSVLDEASLLNLTVSPARRGEGVGRRLLDESRRILASRGVVRLLLDVHESNRAARALYASSGFAVDGRREAYYGDGAALLMSGPVAPVTEEAP